MWRRAPCRELNRISIRSWRGRSGLWAASWRSSVVCASRSSTSERTGARGGNTNPRSTGCITKSALCSAGELSIRWAIESHCPRGRPFAARLIQSDAACRPLPAELLEYAQTDVHYLCFLAGQLCARLASKGHGCLQEAQKRSHEMSLALYSKPTSEVQRSSS